LRWEEPRAHLQEVCVPWVQVKIGRTEPLVPEGGTAQGWENSLSWGPQSDPSHFNPAVPHPPCPVLRPGNHQLCILSPEPPPALAFLGAPHQLPSPPAASLSPMPIRRYPGRIGGAAGCFLDSPICLHAGFSPAPPPRNQCPPDALSSF
jgi:hypothetical protein